MHTRRWTTLLSGVLLLLCLSGFGEDRRRIHQPTLTPQSSETTQVLIAVSSVNDKVVWASGRGGTFVLTTDGGKHWRAGVVLGAQTLQFRDVQGISDRMAYLMSIGSNPTDFRIYKTEDAGSTWKMQFQNQRPGAFYDCFAFWTPKRGIAHSDSVNGAFPDLRTLDGTNWQDMSGNMPPALPREASFSASGTCVATQGARNAWIATGGSSTARILATHNGGNKWSAHNTPLASSPSAGVFTVAFRDPHHGMIGGGDLDPKNPGHAATAISEDGGQSWQLTNKPPIAGAIFGLSYIGGQGIGFDKDASEGDRDQGDDVSRAIVITANAGGAAWSPDEGNTWFALPNVNGYWAVAFASPKSGWLVGTNGRILKISF